MIKVIHILNLIFALSLMNTRLAETTCPGGQVAGGPAGWPGKLEIKLNSSQLA